MHFSPFVTTLFGACAIASPLVARQAAASSAAGSSGTSATVSSPFPIHSSCNTTSTIQLAKGLREAITLSEGARAHLLQYGHNSTLVKKYFGNASTAEPIGWYSRIIGANRADMLFRCDDPDRNCATQNMWGGHWRGSNATSETVICPLSFSTRRPLEQMCTQGLTIAKSPINTFFAVDLLHRILHVPVISEDVVDHYAANYTEVLKLAQTNSTYSGSDSDTIQLFAAEVYAYTVAAPGVGCSGDSPVAAAPAASSAAAPTATSAVAAAASSRPATGTTSAAASCHTHSDGVVHCA